TVNGKSAHGAYPDKGIDAIMIVGHVITAVQSLVSRNISPLNSVVLTLGQIHGGVKDNVIADEVVMTGTLRTLDSETRNYAKQKINEIVSNVAAAFGGIAKAEFNEGYRALINNDEVVDVIKENAEKILCKENIVYKEFPSLGAEDFSYFLDECKGAFFHLGCGNDKKGITADIHTENFDIDEECLKIGIQLQVENVLSLLAK
ncbi:MAG: putative peptidase, partial [Bacillota bacterium]|nr:putative peptidase [Bacillota bacterium]